jgi:hypothetical protein
MFEMKSGGKPLSLQLAVLRFKFMPGDKFRGRDCKVSRVFCWRHRRNPDLSQLLAVVVRKRGGAGEKFSPITPLPAMLRLCI